MTTNTKAWFGGQLSVSTDGVTYTQITQLVDAVSGESSREMADLTVLGSVEKTYAAGSPLDPGEVKFEIAYDPLDTGARKTLIDALYSGALIYFKIGFPPVVANTPYATEIFTGVVKSVSREFAMKDLMRSSVSVQVSGDPGLTQ